VLKYVAVDDCGNQINPLIVDGQVHGGVVQGSPRPSSRRRSTTSDGNLKTSTLAEYLVPAASDVPSITTDHTVTPVAHQRMGVKGIGEAGTIGAAPAVINAIVDALSASACATSHARLPTDVWEGHPRLPTEVPSDPGHVRVQAGLVGRGGHQPRR
jgi:carbon-monoxide dehydrogenase large subunit